MVETINPKESISIENDHFNLKFKSKSLFSNEKDSFLTDFKAQNWPYKIENDQNRPKKYFDQKLNLQQFLISSQTEIF